MLQKFLLIPIVARFITDQQLKSKFEKITLKMSYQNIKEEVIKITKPLSIEDVNDIF